MIEFDQQACNDLETAPTREWLETNGLGGFASSTIIGLNTRRYHGLLVAATKPPVGRMVLLSKLEESLIIDGHRYELSANQYPGIVHPRGHERLKRFRLDPFPIFTYEVEGLEIEKSIFMIDFPIFTYEVEGLEIEKSIFMIDGENSAVIQYELLRRDGDEGRAVSLEVRPLIAFRDYHSTTHENDAINTHVHVAEGLVSVSPYRGMPQLHLAHNGGEAEPTGHWYRNFEYQVERKRGLDFTEDLFNPFVLSFDLSRRVEANIIASTEPRSAARVSAYRQAAIDRRRALIDSAPSDDELTRALVAAADQYLVARAKGKTVIAGYHWFSDWGRDTMIALPGLTLVIERHDVARSILLEFARHVDQGMLPNRFPDEGEKAEYNTVDATLWFFEAVRSLGQYTGDYQFIRASLYPVLKDIIDWHVRGTRYGIRVDGDGLLNSGEEGVQLTWMDAKVGDWVVTPRHGKPVEIQALWYNALRVMEQLAREYGAKPARKLYVEMAERVKKSFNRQFWNEEAGCLYDCIRGEERDGSIRPNQILAVSLSNSMLSRERSKRVVEVVERELLTPFGLRSLSPGDPQYRPRYEGGVLERDSAYHQGTVWPWLMGPFMTAYVKAQGRTKKCRRKAMEWLDAFGEHLSEAGLGQVSEIYDAESPHTPRGCIAQAWSVAELLRAAVEDVFVVTRGGKKEAAQTAAGD